MVHVAASRLIDCLIRRLFALGAALDPVCIGRHFGDAFTWRYSLLCVWGIQCFLLISSLVLIVRFQGVLGKSTSTWWCIKWILHLVLCCPGCLLKHGISASHLWSIVLLKTWSLWPLFQILIHHLLGTAMLSKWRSWPTWLIDILKILLACIDLVEIVWIRDYVNRLLPDLLIFIWWSISFHVLRWFHLILALFMACATLRIEVILIASKLPLFLQESWGRRQDWLRHIWSILCRLRCCHSSIVALLISGYQLCLIREVGLRFRMMVAVDWAHAVGAIILIWLLAWVLNNLLRWMA